MKALTLWQPWATLMAIGAKRVETRSWSTNFRGLVAIHSARSFRRDCMELCFTEPFASALRDGGFVTPGSLPRGAIVAVAELWDCRYIDKRQLWVPADPQELAFGDYMEGRWMWFHTNIRRLKEPVVCSGAQGLWALDPRIEARVREQLEVRDGS